MSVLSSVETDCEQKQKSATITCPARLLPFGRRVVHCSRSASRRVSFFLISVSAHCRELFSQILQSSSGKCGVSRITWLYWDLLSARISSSFASGSAPFKSGLFSSCSGSFFILATISFGCSERAMRKRRKKIVTTSPPECYLRKCRRRHYYQKISNFS